MSEVTELHDPFRRWLGEQGLPYRYSRPDRATSENAADADFWIVLNGRILMVEFKQPKTGKLSAAQVKRHAELAGAGCRVFVLRDLAAAIAVVSEWRRTVGDVAPVVDAPPGDYNNKLVIRQHGTLGDYVFRGSNLLRRATLDDFKTLRRSEP